MPESKLRRLAGVQARCRNPERSERPCDDHTISPVMLSEGACPSRNTPTQMELLRCSRVFLPIPACEILARFSRPRRRLGNVDLGRFSRRLPVALGDRLAKRRDLPRLHQVDGGAAKAAAGHARA